MALAFYRESLKERRKLWGVRHEKNLEILQALFDLYQLRGNEAMKIAINDQIEDIYQSPKINRGL